METMDEPKEIYEIPLKDIRVSEFNVRHTDLEIRIEDLMESIKEHGLLQPVVLRGEYGKPPYDLIVGQRRFIAHKKLGKKTISATFRTGLNDTQAKILSLTENIHRVNLNHADMAEAITALYKEYKNDIQKVAKALGLSPQIIRDYIKIEGQATDKAKELLKQHKIKKTDLRRVIDAAQGDDKKLNELLDIMPKLSKYEKDRAVEFGRKHQNVTVKEIIEESLKPKLETTVILNLPLELADALDKAEKAIFMDRESIASKPLSEWLKNNGFLKV
jgi:ParB family chromosome partitioning protein